MLGAVRSRVLRSPIVLHCFPEQVLVHRAKDFVGQFERPNFYSAQIVNIYSCHMLLMQARASRPSTTLYAFFAALFAAFNGSTVISPANPRRSLGGFFALVMIKYPPFGPGTLPSTTSRLSSFSTPSTRRLRTVTRALPMCPDMRIPLNTLDGNADDPIDPVI